MQAFLGAHQRTVLHVGQFFSYNRTMIEITCFQTMEECKMKNVIGFRIDTPADQEAAPQPVVTHDVPVRSLVSVSFTDIAKNYTYYNDKFDLSVGDMVYVSGKLAGRMGVVASVGTKFKIRLSDYERVIANPHIQFHGHYTQVLDKMIACEGGVSADTFRSWVIAPSAEGETSEIVMGEGYVLPLEYLRSCDDVDMTILRRAIEYCEEGRVRYLSLQNGVGTAFVEGTKWYEVNFRYADGMVTDLYCDCPYPNLCKHSLAVVLTLQVLLDHVPADDFVAIDRQFFFKTIVVGKQDVILR